MATLSDAKKGKRASPNSGFGRLARSYRKETTGNPDPVEENKGFWDGFKSFIGIGGDKKKEKKEEEDPLKSDTFKSFKEKVMKAPSRDEKFKIQFDYQKSLQIAAGTGSKRAADTIKAMKENGYWVER